MESSPTPNNIHPKLDQEYLAKKRTNFEGFEFLRAIFSLAIVAYKTKVFYIPKELAFNDFTYVLSDYILSGMVGALAVPVFLQISLFLFNGKSEKTGLSYFIQKRLPRLVSLYLFWVIAITVFDILFVDGFDAVRQAGSSIKQLVLFIVSGNNTPYFFFFSLIFVTIIAEILILLFSKLRQTSTRIFISYCLLITSSILLFTSSIIEPMIDYKGAQSSLLNLLNSLTQWDYTPLNFLPYIFTAAITAREYNEGKLKKVNKALKRKLYGLFALTFTFFMLESILTRNRLLIQVDQAPLDHYMRLSLVFGSWLLLYLALLAKRSIPASIRFLSDCSLGIYGFHVFFTFKNPIPFDSLPLLGNLFQSFPVLQSLTAFFVALAGSVVLTLLFKRSKLLKSFV